MDPYIGEIRLLPYNFAPVDWLPCDGSSQSISEYTSLFAVIGITYGGNGTTNFNLPDLRGFIPVGPNTTGTSSTVQIAIGQAVGGTAVTLTADQLPLHKHNMNGMSTTTVTGRLTQPASDARPGPVLFNGTTSSTAAQKAFSTTDIPDMTFSPQAIGYNDTVPRAAHPNQQPYLPLNFMIAVNGVFPSPD
jgi:microcystin-dependent protein